MRCAAIDDEPLALKQIVGYIERTPFLEPAAAWPGAVEAVGELAYREIDLLFVDIDMPGLSGLDFVRSLPVAPMVVFTTAYSEYAVEGFRLDATDYLLKPIGYPDFVRAAERAWRRFRQVATARDMGHSGHGADGVHGSYEGLAPSDRPDRIFVKSEYRTVPVEVAAISHIESMGEYMRIHVVGKAHPITTLGSIRSMAERLPAADFMRVHRSHIVNLRRMAAVERGVIITADGTRIPVGEQYREEFRGYMERNTFSK
ncbi:MAG: LytTR family DNA-binding domain-containing protein [Alistipes sp.]|nr:LytTR family DNA-binding domain-containing protein [Alistipes sp.]